MYHRWQRYRGEIEIEVLDPHYVTLNPQEPYPYMPSVVDPTPAPVEGVQSANMATLGFGLQNQTIGGLGSQASGGGGNPNGIAGGYVNVANFVSSQPIPQVFQPSSAVDPQTIQQAYNNSIDSIMRQWQPISEVSPRSEEDPLRAERERLNGLLQYAQEYPLTIDEPLASTAKKKVAKIHKHASAKQVARAIAKYTKKKAQQVVNQTNTMEATIASEKQRLTDRQREVRSAENRINFYKNSKNRLAKKPHQLVTEFEQAIIDLKTRVESIVTDTKGRIIVTTYPLTLQKQSWVEPRTIGKFQIRIDFSQPDISVGIRVLNITRAYDGYDTPTISKTLCCWGNVKKDIHRDFFTQNIEELVIDMIDYIASPFELHGFLVGEGGDKSKAWEMWFEKATDREAGYTFENFDQQHPGRDIPTYTGDAFASSLESDLLLLSNDQTLDTPRNNTIDVLQANLQLYEETNRNLQRQVQEFQPQPISGYERALLAALEHCGFHRRSVYHYFNYIIHDAPRQVTMLELRRVDGAIILHTGDRRYYMNREDFSGDIPHYLETHPQFQVPVRIPQVMSFDAGSAISMWQQEYGTLSATSIAPLTTNVTSASTTLTETALNNMFNMRILDGHQDMTIEQREAGALGFNPIPAPPTASELHAVSIGDNPMEGTITVIPSEQNTTITLDQPVQETQAAGAIQQI